MEKKYFVTKKVSPNAIVPRKEYADSIGYDLYTPYDYDLPAHSVGTIDTGLRITPPPGFWIKITVRSSGSLKNIGVGGGTVDPGYTDNLHVILHNFSSEPRRFQRGEKIAQMFFMRHEEVTQYEEVVPGLEYRGARGLGSSGNGLTMEVTTTAV